jgi:hypothetical protein
MSLVLLLSIALIWPGQLDRDKETVARISSTENSSPYAHWQHGPAADRGFFPIAVWLQDPRNAGRYKQAGINLYVGLWQGPTEAQVAALKSSGMQVICHQNRVGLAHRGDPTIVGWMHGDEPDNAQEVRDEKTGRRRYGPPIAPAKIVAGYERLRAADPTRPVLLNLGQGVANDDWKGRGPRASIDDYPAYVRGADIVSFDVYPVACLDRPDGAEFLWLNGSTVRSSDPEVPIDMMIKQRRVTTYVFAVGMRNRSGRGSFVLHGLPGETTAQVLGEDRRLATKDGHFADDVAAYGVHIYEITRNGTGGSARDPSASE